MATPLPQLLAALATGDATARDELVRRLQPKVQDLVQAALEREFRRSQRWVLSLLATSDVVREVLAQVVRDEQAPRGDDEAALAAHFAEQVRHRLSDEVRLRRAAPGPATLAQFAEQVRAFEQVLASLQPRHRSLLEARLVEGAEFDAIASRLGYASADTARKIFAEVHAKVLLQLRTRGIALREGNSA